MIEKNTSQFLAEQPGMKYLFFGGKGGVGKTVMAGAAALRFAQQGKRTLLASTNPVHSLTSMLGQAQRWRTSPKQRHSSNHGSSSLPRAAFSLG